MGDWLGKSMCLATSYPPRYGTAGNAFSYC